MRRLIAQIRKEFTDPVPKRSAVLVVVVGFFIGTVFTVGEHY